MSETLLPPELAKALSRGRHDIVFFAEELLGMPLHDGQKRFLWKATKKINLLVSGNRWGKSTVIAILHIWYNFYKIGINPGNAEAWQKAVYRTGNIAPHSKLVEPVFNAIKMIMSSSFPIPQPDGTLQSNHCLISWALREEGIRNTAPQLIPFDNNANVEFASTGEDKGDSIQGRPFGMLSYDEGGRSNHLELEVEANLLGRLGDWNGRLYIPSTPDVDSASILYHHELFLKGQNQNNRDIYSQEGSAEENHFLPANYVPDTVRRMKGNPLLDQVVYGKFVFAGSNIYPATDIEAAVDTGLDHGTRYQTNHRYIIGIDTSFGNDECVFTVLDETSNVNELVQCIAFKGSSNSPQMQQHLLRSLFLDYNHDNNVRIILEVFNGESGRFYADMDHDMQLVTKLWGTWRPEGYPRPKNMNAQKMKAEILIALRKVLADRTLKIPNDRKLIQQLSIYRENDTNIPTDRLISLALAVWFATDGQPKHTVAEAVTVSW